ncbi:MAG TPA: PAS domain S-box protein [Salinivirgaceae bacterium]|nr:PAS domain S-box protein [Salinivirgaceae bacterium]
MWNLSDLSKESVFKSIIDQSANLILFTDKNGIIQYANPRFCEVSKYTLQELIGKPSSISKSGAQPPEFYQNLWTTIKSGKPFRGEFKNRDKNGDFYWIYSTISPLYDDNQNITHFVSISENITYRKLLERTSFFSESFVKNLFSNLQKTGIILIDINNTILLAEGETISLLTKRTKPGIQQHISSLAEELGNLDFQSYVNQVFSSGKSKTLELNLEHISLRIVLIPIIGVQENIEYCLALIQDITEYFRLIKSINETKEQYEAIFENAGAAIASINPSGIIEKCNSTFYEIFEFDNQKENSSIENLFDNSQRLELFQHINAFTFKNEQEPYRKIFTITTSSGIKKWIDLTISSWKHPINNELKIILIGFDISEAVRTREQLSEQEKILREMNSTKDRFFSIISHDLRNPFNSILGFSEYLLQNFDSTDLKDTKRFIGIIHNAALNTFELLENLLEWSRTQRGKIEYNPKIQPIKPMIENVVDQLSMMAERKEVSISLEVDSTLTGFFDVNLISTVIRNLITNAIKFSYRKSTIEIEAQSQENQTNISVTDHGIGISKETQDKLFNLNEIQSQKGTEQEAGTGLGLVLCKEFTALNKGQLSVKSEPGVFTTFTVSLPKTDH